MKSARKITQVSRRFYRREQYHCADCQRRLRRAVTLTERTVIRLDEVIKLVHAGYRCPDAQCAGHQRTYRSVRADALALPWFTYGVDIVLLVGRLRLREHQTVDEIHQELLKRLEPLGVKIARREILYLFEAYCTLLRASSEAKDDVEWLAQVEKNGGIIVSVDGIQPEKGNETPKKVNCWQSRSSGRRCRTRCVSSTCCATRRKWPLRPTSRSKQPCANASNRREGRCANRSRSA